MRIEFKNPELQHVDAENNARVRFELQFWDNRNNLLERTRVQGYENKSGSGAPEQFCDVATNVDGKLNVTMVINIVRETRRELLFAMEDQQEKVVVELGKIFPAVKQKLQQIELERQREAEKIESEKKEARIARSRELGQFQNTMGVGRIFIGTGWVLIDATGKILSSEFADIKPFDEKKKTAMAKPKPGDWYVPINPKGQILDEKTGLPMHHVPNATDINKITFTPHFTEETEEMPYQLSWKNEFDEFMAACKQYKPIFPKAVPLYRYSTRFDYDQQYQEQESRKQHNTERIEKLMKYIYLQRRKFSHYPQENERRLFGGSSRDLGLEMSWVSLAETDLSKEITHFVVDPTKLNGIEMIRIQDYFKELFLEKIHNEYIEMRKSECEITSRTTTGTNVNVLFSGNAVFLDLHAVCNFLAEHPRMKARIVIQGQEFAYLDKSIDKNQALETQLHKQHASDLLPTMSNVRIEVRIMDECGTEKTVISQSFTGIHKISWGTQKPVILPYINPINALKVPDTQSAKRNNIIFAMVKGQIISTGDLPAGVDIPALPKDPEIPRLASFSDRLKEQLKSYKPLESKVDVNEFIVPNNIFGLSDADQKSLDEITQRVIKGIKNRK